MTDLPIRHDRYPGARPFTDNPEDRRLFFGREDEVETLYHQVLSARLLVLFGKSGLGKTSLLQAGVMPRLRKRDLLPLSVRLNRTDVDPVELVIDAVEEGCKAQGIDYTEGERTSLWEFFKTAMFWRGDALQTPVLVMDQFEEIFTLQSIENRRLLAEQLGELVGAGLPAAVRAKRKAGEKLPYSERPPALKVILSLREEYFGALQELTREVLKILETRFRITPLHREQAKRAVVEPARLADGNTFSTRPFQYADKAVQTMLDFLEAETGEIESFQLQILCRHVEEQVKRKQAAGAREVTVDPTYLGERKAMDAILQNFYLDTIKTLPARRDRRHTRRLCEVGLLNAAGRRKSLDEEDVVRDYKVHPPILARLEDQRLLRKEPRLGAFYYELRHDSLAQPVMNSRRLRLPKHVLIILVVVVPAAIGVAFWQFARAAEATRAQRESFLILKRLNRFPEMIEISPGKFMMGSTDKEAGRESDEGPPSREVKIKPFLIGKYEVTFDQYDIFALTTSRSLPDDEGWGRGKRPVINVSWEDAVGYAAWLSRLTGKPYRLPTEAEWEYASRAGSITAFSFGNDSNDLKKYAWYSDNSEGRTHLVGERKPNDWELHDMHGNVWEWVEDDWHFDYEGATTDGKAWIDEPSGALRVIRGGSWVNDARNCRSVNRYRRRAVNRYNYVGFRLSR